MFILAFLPTVRIVGVSWAWKANGDDGDGGCVLLMRRGFGGGELRRGG